MPPHHAIWVDGQLVPREEAPVSVFDHGLLYGDGVFEGIRIYDRRIFRLDAHLDRLYDSAQGDRARRCRSTARRWSPRVGETVSANRQEDGYIRLVVTRGDGELGVDPTKCPKPSVIIIVTEIPVYPAEHYAAGMRVITSATRQVPHEASTRASSRSTT